MVLDFSRGTRTMWEYFAFRSQGWKGLGAADWLAQLKPLQEWLSQNPGEVIVHLPNREVRKVHTPQGVLYVKLLNAGGSLGGVKGALTAIKWALRPSRAIAILRISQELLDAGFQCPIPIVAARRRSTNGWPQDIFISLDCPGVPLTRLLPNMQPNEIQSLLATVASEIARLHQAGFVHGDCIPGNIAISPSGKVIFFDHDRTCRAPQSRLLRHQQRRNLVQFGYRLMQLLQDRRYVEYFLARYASEHWAPEAAARELDQVRQRIQKRQGKSSQLSSN